MARRIDDEMVILDVRSGRYFELNDVGALVWDRLEDDARVDELVDAVVAEYDAPREVVSKDVEDLLGQLITAGLVVAVS